MKTLHLNIKNGIGIQYRTGGFLDIFRQTLLIGTLDLGKSIQKGSIRFISGQFRKSFGLPDPRLPDGLGDKRGQPGVGLDQKSPVGDAVGLVIEFFGTYRIEILDGIAL